MLYYTSFFSVTHTVSNVPVLRTPKTKENMYETPTKSCSNKCGKNGPLRNHRLRLFWKRKKNDVSGFPKFLPRGIQGR